MCAILGGNNSSWDYTSSINVMSHRGPDGKRIFSDGIVTLGFSRLAILDLSDEAMQPMFTEDGKVGIVYNGEIYGFEELKDELSEYYHFKTHCDTEVILYSYLHYGMDFLDHIDGMFAIAIYDKRVNKLFLIRDRVGIKPLYYYEDGINLVFSSELKAIEQIVPYKLKIDNTAIYDYLIYQYIPTPKSIYRMVHKLPPATFLEYDLKTNRFVKHKYWNFMPSTLEGAGVKFINQQEIEAKCRSLIRKTVKQQLIADVPIGIMLSGGIDSSVLACEAKKISENICSFSLDFSYRRLSEKEYINAVVDKIKIDNVTFYMTNREIEDNYTAIRKWFDEPFSDIGAYSNWFLTKSEKSYIKVALAGDGGDELFAGYPRHFRFLNDDSMDCSEDKDRLFNCIADDMSAANKNIRQYYRIKLDIPDDYDDYWFWKKYYIRELPPITRLQYMDFCTYLPESVLTKTDRTSMAESLETRVPYLSRDLIEFIYNLSQNERCGNSGVSKWLIKQAYAGDLPREVLTRKKMGFNSPGFLGLNCPQQKILNDIWGDLL